jgi:hypothetical protein
VTPTGCGFASDHKIATAEAVLTTGADFLFVCKRDSHKTLYEYVEGAPLDKHEVTERKPGNRRLTYRYRWIEGVPLRDGKDAMNVNWLGVSILDAKGKTTYDGAFVTSLPVTAENVVEIAACARARWKIENESFNVLKNNGYNLARTFATMNLLAFAFHTACDCLETLWQQAREAIGTRPRFFQELHIISAFLVFPSWTSGVVPQLETMALAPDGMVRYCLRLVTVARCLPSLSTSRNDAPCWAASKVNIKGLLDTAHCAVFRFTWAVPLALLGSEGEGSSSIKGDVK